MNLTAHHLKAHQQNSNIHPETQYETNQYPEAQRETNHYQNYTWVSPKALEKQARRSTRARGVFPSRIVTTRYQLGRTLQYTHDEIMRTTGNFIVSLFSMMAIAISLAAMVAV